MSETLSTGICRWVGLDPFTLSNEGFEGNILETPELGILVAIDKNSPSVAAIFNAAYSEACGGYPERASIAAGQPNSFLSAAGGLDLDGFSWKISDGDSVKNAGKEGRAGCWILACKSKFNVFVGKYVNGSYVQIGPDEIKKGYFVDVGFDFKCNGIKTGNAGLYCNLNSVLLKGVGDVIATGPTPEQIYGQATDTGYVPPGMQPLPATAAPAPAMPATAAPAPAMPATAAPAPAMPATAAPAPAMPATAAPAPAMPATAAPAPAMPATAAPAPAAPNAPLTGFANGQVVGQ